MKQYLDFKYFKLWSFWDWIFDKKVHEEFHILPHLEVVVTENSKCLSGGWGWIYWEININNK